jgi:hydroxyacylglutathione hydrolase
VILKRFYDDKLAQASFLIGCGATGEALVLDPNRDVEQYVRAAAAEKLRITAVTETHIHADFVSGARELAEKAGARLYLSDEGDAEWKYGFASQPNVKLVRDGDSIRIGNVRLDVMKTPGHTPEHIAFVLTDEPASKEPLAVFTGDFVFVGDVGRPDLLERAANYAGTMEKGARALFDSLRKFRKLPGHLMLWPGHGAGSACGKNLGGLPATTLQYEMLSNWAVRCEDETAFVREVLAGQPEPPAYFKEMKRINKQGPAFLGGFKEPEKLETSRIVELIDRGEVVVDLRTSRANATGAIPGTLHIPAGTTFTTWAGWLLSYDRPFYLIAADVAEVRTAVHDLAMIGLDRVAGWFPPAALDAWTQAGRALVPTAGISARDAMKRLAAGEIALLDVRGSSEYNNGHVPGVVHVPLGYLASRVAELPKDRPIAVHCQAGTRSPIAISVLRRAGFQNLLDVRGGFAEFAAERLGASSSAAEELRPS